MKFLVFLFFLTSTNARIVSESFCETPECQDYAKRLRNNMDTTVEPCDNFYKFACGNFNPDLSSNTAEFSEATSLNNAIKDHLTATLSEEINDADTKSLKVTKKFYQLCMDEKKIRREKFDFIVEKMKLFGGWPMIESHNWREQEWNIHQVFKSMEIRGLENPFFMINAEPNFYNNSQIVLKFDFPILTNYRVNYMINFNETFREVYWDLLKEIAEYSGVDETTFNDNYNELTGFQKDLMEIAVTKNYNGLFKMTIHEVQRKFPSINWLNFLSKLLPPRNQIDEYEIIFVLFENILEDIHQLFESTSKRTLANYFMLSVAYNFAFKMPKNTFKSLLKFEQLVNGKVDDERSSSCVKMTIANFSPVTSSIYVKHYFNENSKNEAMGILLNIRGEFEQTLIENNWMDQNTKNAALRKLQKIKFVLGYLDTIKDDQVLDDYYKYLIINNESFLEVVMKILKFKNFKTLNKFGKPADKNLQLFLANIAEVNANYNSIYNRIMIKAGALQGHFFSLNRPHYLNYGALGSTIGHEIVHAFDDGGSDYDEDGNFHNWWGSSTRIIFDEKAQCIKEQYGTFIDPQMRIKIDGRRTLSENIADNSGYVTAYRAYQTWTKTNGQEPKLKGFDFTPNQHFWLSMAQKYCWKYSNAYLRHRIETNEHSPPSIRINGVLSNSEEFLRDFHCPKYSKMKMQKKCKVW